MVGPPVARPLAVLLVLTALAGCAPKPAPIAPSGSSDASTVAAKRVGPNRATLAIGAEVNFLASKLESANTYAAEISFIVNSPLVALDPRGEARPLLAAELPSRDNGTWSVNPDGTMETVWALRPNARWHDGQPVTVGDFAFALRVYKDESVPS